MALLKSGKVYDIKIYYNPWTNWPTEEQFLNNFITEYKRQTGITDPEYSTIKSYYDENENEHKYFNLPYINNPLTTSKGNLYLCFRFSTNLIGSTSRIPSPYLIARRNQNEILDKFYWPASYPIVDLGNDTYRTKQSGAFGAYTAAYSDVDEDGCAWMHIDTRFLDSHKFYTIDVITFTDDIEEICYIRDVKDVYFSPTIFICDMVDQVTGKHYDSIFTIRHTSGGISDLSNPTQTNGNILRGLGITFDEDGIEKYAQNSFYPQLYAEDSSSIVLQKLQFGRLKSNNIYITNRYKNNIFQTLTNNGKMSEYKDGWIQDILYKDDKKFIIGTNSDDGNYYSEDYFIYNLYIPVIKGDTIPEPPVKLVPWSTGTDEEITAMINGFYNGTITLEEIKSVWKLGDKRKIHLNAMPASGIIEAHRAQDIDFEIIGFEHDTLTTPINGHTKALISLDQKDCLSDGQDGVRNTERGFMSPNNASTGTGWKGCARRDWCNTIYINAFPQYMQNLIKAVNKLTATSSTNSTISTTSDKGFLLSEIELFGGRRYSFAGEGTHYEYFTTGTDQNGKDKWKNPEWDSTSVYWYHHSGSAYWLRSPERNTSSSRKTFTSVTSSGNYAYYSEGSNAMFAPAICL